MKKKINTKESSPRGYDIDELRHQIILKTLQMEFCKEKLVNTYKVVSENAPFVGKKSRENSAGLSLLSSVMKGLSYADYFTVGIAVFKAVKGIRSLFKRKKKS